MKVLDQINSYIESLPESKKEDLGILHKFMVETYPTHQLWFLDGKNSDNKTVSNPNIGYGKCTLKYANGGTKEFYQVGLSANTSGISVFIFGLEDKNVLNETFGKVLGKASVSSYCIKFKSLKDINFDVLKSAIKFGMEL